MTFARVNGVVEADCCLHRTVCVAAGSATSLRRGFRVGVPDSQNLQHRRWYFSRFLFPPCFFLFVAASVSHLQPGRLLRRSVRHLAAVYFSTTSQTLVAICINAQFIIAALVNKVYQTELPFRAALARFDQRNTASPSEQLPT